MFSTSLDIGVYGYRTSQTDKKSCATGSSGCNLQQLSKLMQLQARKDLFGLGSGTNLLGKNNNNYLTIHT